MPKMQLVFKFFAKLCFSILTPLPVLPQIRDICRRLNRGWVLGEGYYEQRWFALISPPMPNCPPSDQLMATQTVQCNRFCGNIQHQKHFYWESSISNQSKKYNTYTIQPFSETHALNPEVLNVFGVSANMSSHQASGWLYAKGFGMSTMNNGTILLPLCTPTHPPKNYQTWAWAWFFQSQFPPNSEPLLSCYPAPTPFSFCDSPDCWIGAKRSDSQRGQS